VRDITANLILSIVASSALLVFYSKKELSKRQFLVRYTIHFSIILTTTLIVARRMGWIRMNEALMVGTFVALVLTVYIVIVVYDLCQSKKVVNELNQRLKEKYKK